MALLLGNGAPSGNGLAASVVKIGNIQAWQIVLVHVILRRCST